MKEYVSKAFEKVYEVEDQMVQIEMEGAEMVESWVQKKKEINDAVMKSALNNGLAR